MHRVVACDRRPAGGLPSHHYSSALLGTQSTCSAPSSRFLLLPPGSVGIRFKILDPGPRLTRRGGPARPGRRLAGEEFTQTELTRPTPMKRSKQEHLQGGKRRGVHGARGGGESRACRDGRTNRQTRRARDATRSKSSTGNVYRRSRFWSVQDGKVH